MKNHKLLYLLLCLSTIFLVVAVNQRHADAPKPKETTVKKAPKVLKNFTGQQFAELYDSFAYPNTQQINEDSPITGNIQADRHLRELAVARGYKIRSAPVTDTFVEVEKDMLLQQRAAKPWLDLKKAAAKDQMKIRLAAAYRSAEDEKDIFLSRLKGIDVKAIADGKADSIINAVLDHTALPGYSRHHTGYTIDIACDSDPGVKFEQSACFKWLSANNYLHAKKYGWIPSYPAGAGEQGPLPEAWEYVWVGTDALSG